MNALLRSAELHALSSAAGFEHESTVDLSPYLEIGRVRDRGINVLLTLLGWLPPGLTRFEHLQGGSALQKALARGWVAYDFAVFRRR